MVPVPELVLWLVFAGMIAYLLVRSLRRDRREYQRFKRYRTTARRQASYRRWLRESFLAFGTIGVVGSVLAADRIPALVAQVHGWTWVAAVRTWSEAWPWVGPAVVAAAVAGAVALTVVGIVSARRHPEELISIGDIRALLPRNREELVWTGALSLNAGVMEELAFRFAVPAVLFGASGDAVLTIVVSVLLFGILHLYQGVIGVVGAALIGALMMALLVVSGTILVPMLAHVLIDLRSLVLIPVTVLGAHRSGRSSRHRAAPEVRSATRTS